MSFFLSEVFSIVYDPKYLKITLDIRTPLGYTVNVS